MMPQWLVFFMGLSVAMAVTPIIRLLAIRVGALDRPVSRSVHTKPIPFLGGVAIFIAFLLATLYASSLDGLRNVHGILLGGFFILIFGIVDDYKALTPKVKLVGQVVAAVILLGFGVRIDYITNPFGGLIWLGVWGIPFTILWVVTVINVINLIDGLDGLAAGIASIASLTLLVSAIQNGQSASAIALAAALAGSTLGFLPYNFNPAKIFMGDAGSMFLGFALAAISIEGSLKSPTAVALAVPVLALGLPILDTALAVIRRVRRGIPIGCADKEHLHHRLLQMGLSQREAVWVMYIISGWLGISAVVITGVSHWLAVVIILFIALTIYLGVKKAGMLDPGTGHRGMHS